MAAGDVRGLVLGGLGLLAGGGQGAGARHGGRTLQGRRGGARPGGGGWTVPGIGAVRGSARRGSTRGAGARVDRVGHSASVEEALETALAARVGLGTPTATP